MMLFSVVAKCNRTFREKQNRVEIQWAGQESHNALKFGGVANAKHDLNGEGNCKREARPWFAANKIIPGLNASFT